MSLATTATPPLASAGALTSARSAPFRPAARRRIAAYGWVAAGDIATVLLPLLLVLTHRHVASWPATVREALALRVTLHDIGVLAVFGVLVTVVFHAAGLYDAARVRRWSEELARAALGITMVVLAVAFVATSSHPAMLDRESLLLFWAASATAAAATRGVRTALTRPAVCRRAVVVGSGPQALRICRELSRHPLVSYRVLGFIDTVEGDAPARSPFVLRRTLGGLDQLETILAREHVDEVHVGLPVKSRYPQIQETIRVCERLGVKLVYDADVFDTALARPRVSGATWTTPRVELQLVTDGAPVVIKRLVDILGAAAALVLLAPLMLATAIGITLTSRGPIIYAQERYGLNRSRFRMYKFRTMVVDAERLQAALESRNEARGPVFKIANDPRVTPIGRWLRRTSIDELPQLFNVLLGDMSLVGPRPLPIRDVLLFTRSSDLRRFSVRPGVTGLWQVSGRSRLDFDSWITLDLHYIDHWSLALDLRILARTIPAVIRGTGAV